MEAETSLVWADGRIELHAIAEVHLRLAAVIYPRHAEDDDAFGFDEAFEE